MDVEFMTVDTALYAPAEAHAAAAGQQHRKGDVRLYAGRTLFIRRGGRERDSVYYLPHREAGGGPLPQPTDL